MKKSFLYGLILSFFVSGSLSAEVLREQTSTADSPAGGAQEYVDKVQKNREKYGNKDGLYHATLLNGERFGFTLGYMNWTNGLEANGPYFGLNYLTSINDNVGVEMSGGYGLGSSERNKVKTDVGRFDFSLAVRGQLALASSTPYKALVPFLAAGPVYSRINTDTSAVGFSTSGSSNSIGFLVAPGIDLFLGGMSMGIRANYIISTSLVTGGGDTSMLVPQFTVGWAF